LPGTYLAFVSGGFPDNFRLDIIAGPHGTSLKMDRKTTKSQIKLGFFCQNHAGKGLDVVPNLFFS
jgi:hypothetical protein